MGPLWHIASFRGNAALRSLSKQSGLCPTKSPLQNAYREAWPGALRRRRRERREWATQPPRHQRVTIPTSAPWYNIALGRFAAQYGKTFGETPYAERMARLFQRSLDAKDGERNYMLRIDRAPMATMLLAVGMLGYACVAATAAVRIEGQVQAGGGPLANSTVTLWGASAGEPRQLAQARTGSDGRFELGSQETLGTDAILYLVAKGGEAAVNKGSGDNPAIAMLAVLGNTPPPRVVVNEMTTVASVWTHAQFLNGRSEEHTSELQSLRH